MIPAYPDFILCWSEMTAEERKIAIQLEQEAVAARNWANKLDPKTIHRSPMYDGYTDSDYQDAKNKLKAAETAYYDFHKKLYAEKHCSQGATNE